MTTRTNLKWPNIDQFRGKIHILTKIQNCTKTINEIYCTLMSIQKHPLTASHDIQRDCSPQMNLWERFDYSFGRV